MNLLQSWKESLNTLQPRQLKLFMLVTIKSIGDALKLLFSYFWWYLIPTVSLSFLVFSFGSQGLLPFSTVTVNALFFVLTITAEIDRFLIILSTRPSVYKKTYAYFGHYFTHFWYLVVLSILVLRFGLQLIMSFFAHAFVYPFFVFVILIFKDLFILFALDSDGSPRQLVKSCVRTTKMLVYNAPLWGIIFFVDYILRSAIHWSSLLVRLLGVGLIEQGWLGVLLFLYLVIKICFVTNVYIKKVHEQSDLYFPQP